MNSSVTRCESVGHSSKANCTSIPEIVTDQVNLEDARPSRPQRKRKPTSWLVVTSSNQRTYNESSRSTGFFIQSMEPAYSREFDLAAERTKPFKIKACRIKCPFRCGLVKRQRLCDVVKGLDTSNQCPICLEHYTQDKFDILGCGHLVCTVCVCRGVQVSARATDGVNST